MTPQDRCPLCESAAIGWHARTLDRDYLHCRICDLAWMSPEHWLDRDAERAYYSTHENSPSDSSYRRFLSRLAAPLMARLPARARGLDYGSGPGPTLSVMLEEQGFPTAVYDPYFSPDTRVLDTRYDFVTCSETAEHFHAPGLEFARLRGLLKPGGRLGLMTGFRPELPVFARWHYLRDPTHICLYSRRSLAWIGDRFDWSLEIPAENVAIFRTH